MFKLSIKIISLILFLSACGVSEKYSPGTDNNEPEVKSDAPVFLTGLSVNDLVAMGITYEVTNEEARAVSNWMARCYPDLISKEKLADYVVSQEENGEKKRYRLFPILASYNERTKKKSNPSRFNVNIIWISEDHESAPCDLPDDYKVVGFVSASTQLKEGEYNESSVVDLDFQEEVEATNPVTQCKDEVDLDIKKPDQKSSYSLKSYCNKGTRKYYLEITPPTEYWLIPYSVSKNSNGSYSCQNMKKSIDLLEQLQKDIDNAPTKNAKKAFQELFDEVDGDLFSMSRKRGFTFTHIYDKRLYFQGLVEDFKTLNDFENLTIRMNESLYVTETYLSVNKDEASPYIQEFLEDVKGVSPTFNVPYITGTFITEFNTNLATSCFMTEFSGDTKDLRKYDAKIKHVYE